MRSTEFPFELAWVLAFAIPAVLLLVMPGWRALALATLAIGASVTVAVRMHEAGITEATDGPGSALIVLLQWTSYTGLAVGGPIRALVLLLRRERVQTG